MELEMLNDPLCETATGRAKRADDTKVGGKTGRAEGRESEGLKKGRRQQMSDGDRRDGDRSDGDRREGDR
eukprot:677858-Hanusia_phi.AAC.1